MKRLLSFENMEKGLKDYPLPVIDVKFEVMNRINSKSNKTSWNLKKVTISTIAISVMLIVTTLGVYAAINGWQLRNKKGEVVYSLKNMTQDEYIAMNQGAVEKERLWNLVDNGEVVLIGDLKNPQFTLYRIEKSEKIFDITKVKELVGQDMQSTIRIPEGYKFRYAMFHYDYKEPDKESKEKAIEDAVKKGERYVKIPFNRTDTLTSFAISYNKQVGKHRIEVFEDHYLLTNGLLEGKAYDPENKIEKITAGDREVLFRRSNETQSVSWVDMIDGRAVSYLIIGSKDIPKDELINAVKEID